MSQDDLGDLQFSIEEQGYSWEAGETSLSILQPEEQKRRLGVTMPPGEMDRLAIAFAEMAFVVAEFPAAWDWRDVDGADWTTAIRDQQGCGSCVAFGTVAVLETMLKLHEQDATLQPDLSEAHLFFCGCEDCCDKGWWPSIALNYAQHSGVPDESCFPYQDHDMPCSDSCEDWRGRALRVVSWKEVFDMGARKEWLATKGPMIGILTVYQDFFNYARGVYRHTAGDRAGLHAICVVGYSEEEQCWICKNSWDTGWGDGGWFKIGYGEAGMDTVFPMWGVEEITPPSPGPVFTPIDPVALSENERFLLRIEAKDPDLPSETVSLVVSDKPRFARFKDKGRGIGELDLRPGYEDAGTYTMDVTATDSRGHTATTTVTIHVINVNRPPRLRPIEDQYLYEGQRRRVPISCDNPDRVSVTWATTQLPDFVNFEGHGDGTGVLTIAPSFEEKGLYTHHHKAEHSIGITAGSPETSGAIPSRETFKIKVCDFKYDRPNRGLITLVSKDATEDQWTVVQWQDRQGKWHDVTGWQGNFDEFIGEAVGAKTWAVVEEAQFGTSPFRWQILRKAGGKSLKTSDPFQLPTAEGDIVFVDA